MADVQLLNGDDWEKAHLLMNESGTWPRVCLANTVAILTHHPAWQGRIAFDESRGEIIMAGPDAPRTWTDSDDTATAVWLQRARFSAKPEMVAQAVGLIASLHKVNPLVAYLRGLRWDGVPRLDTWLTTYAGAEDSPYVRGVGAAWMRSAVARALHPGCKVDTALILEGGQGKGKSTLLAILGGAHFTDDVADLHSKDAAQQIRRAWIVELPELAAGKRSEVEAQKAFVARSTDRYRPAYARRVIEEPRRCVFAGTTNAQGYLQDGTGNRRWWPVPCGQIDLDALRADRDQLWAEAVEGYLSGLGWGLDPALWHAAGEEQEARHVGDTWEDAIAEWLEGRESASVEEILAGCMQIDRERHGRHEQMRVSGILQRLRWHRRQVRVGNRRPWRYFPPLPDPAPTETSTNPVTNPSEAATAARKAVVSPTSPTSERSANSTPAASFTFTNPKEVGDLGDVGDKRVNQGATAATNGGTNPHKAVGDRAAWLATEAAWRVRMAPHTAPARLDGLARELTEREHGPCPATLDDLGPVPGEVGS